MHYDLMTGLYRLTPFLLILTAFTTLSKSMREKIENHSVEIMSEVSQKSSEQIVT